ncbi:MAG: hypothetical protein J7K51_06990 [Thermotogae bacterium]|nr:hypothetical protein [Thermotogota bacterium]
MYLKQEVSYEDHTPEEGKDKSHSIRGLLLVHDFIRNIGLEAFVKDRFPPPGSNRGKSPWQFISSTILMQHAGGRKVIDIRDDKILDILDTSLDSRTWKEGVLGIIVR